MPTSLYSRVAYQQVMSLIRSRLPVASGSAERQVRERRKAVLFCPRCSHENPIDGDWVWRRREDGTEVRCPNCYELLTFRREFDETE